MAIDPSIVLGIRPVQTENPLDALTKIQSARNLIAQTQLHQQQAKMDQAKFEREQQQNAEADRQSAAAKLQGELIAKNTDEQGNTNYQGVIQGLAKAGHGKEAVAYDAQRRADEKTAIDNQKTQIENSKKQLDAMGGALQSLSQVPDEQLAAAYDQNLQQLTQQGLVKPGTVPPSQAILQQGGIAGLRQFVNQHAQAAMSADQQITAHQKDVEFAQKVNEFHQKVLDQAPKTKKEWTDLAGQVLGAAQNQQQWDAGLKNLAVGGANGSAPLDVVSQFGSTYSPEAAARASQLGMTPKDRMEEMDKAKPRPGVDVPLPSDVAAQKVEIAKASRPPSEAAQNTLDREAKQFGGSHAKSLDAANSQLEKISDARAMINGNAASQALGIPKVLTALVGGQGSGVRITQAELTSIAKARGIVGDVEGFFNSISGQGKLTDTQKKQLTGIMDDVKTRVEQKRAIANDALDRINSAKNRDDIVAIDKEARGKIADLEKGPASASGGKIRVKRKSDGQTGTIDAKDFDEKKYDKL